MLRIGVGIRHADSKWVVKKLRTVARTQLLNDKRETMLVAIGEDVVDRSVDFGDGFAVISWRRRWRDTAPQILRLSSKASHKSDGS